MSWVENTKFRLKGFAILMTFICPGFLIWMATATARQIASRNWPSVEGEVQDVIAKNWWDQDSQTAKYYGRVVYRYSVNGSEYTSDLTDLGPGTKRVDPNEALADVSRYQPGMKLHVYYDPGDPATAVIENGIPAPHLALLIEMSVGTVVGAVSSFFIIRGWLKKRQPRTTESLQT